MNFLKKTVLITGASSGLGRALTCLLADKQANLIIVARNKQKLAELKENLCQQKKINILDIVCDISQEDQITKMFEQAIKHFKNIDLIISNAGTNVKKPLSEISLKEWNNVMSVNTTGNFLILKYAQKHLQKTKMAIISSILVFFPAKYYTLYAASKTAVDGMVKSLRKEVSKNFKLYLFHPYRLNTNFHKNYQYKSPQSHMIDPKLYAEFLLAKVSGKYFLAIYLFLRNWLIRFWQIINN